MVDYPALAGVILTMASASVILGKYIERFMQSVGKTKANRNDIDELDNRIDDVEGKVDTVDNKVDRLDSKMETVREETMDAHDTLMRAIVERNNGGEGAKDSED